jgi:site-specific recombinase XerD
MERHLAHMVARGVLRQEDAGDVLAYLRDKTIRSDPSEITLTVQARYLSQFCRALPRTVKDCTSNEIMVALAGYRKGHAQNTFRQMVIYVIQFLRFLSMDTDEIGDMMPARKWNTKNAGDMLTSEEVDALIAAARTSRDRALVSMLYEGGFRPIELSRLMWRDVKFDQYGAVVNTAEKTGKPRYIRLTWSAKALAQWQQDCRRETGPVFTDIRPGRQQDRGISTHAINDMVADLVRRADIRKRAYPYLLRHTRITHLMEDGVPESVIKKIHWGDVNTSMLATYAHISDQHIDQVMLEHAGIDKPGKRARASAKPVTCQGCKTLNLPGSQRCAMCGRSFTEIAEYEDARVRDIALTALLEDPEILKILKKRQRDPGRE